MIFSKKYFMLLVMVVCCQTLIAQQKKPHSHWADFEISLGGFLNNTNTTARFGSGALGLGVNVDFENALGLESTSLVLRADAALRIGRSKRSFMELGYFSFTKRSTKTLEAEFELYDEIYSSGTTIASKFSFKIIQFSYGYSIIKKDEFDLAATFGFYVLPIDLELNVSQMEAQETKFIAPLPIFGLHFYTALSPKFYLKQKISVLYIKYGNFSGAISDILISLEYRPIKHFGLGLGVNSFSLTVEATGGEYPLVEFEGFFGYRFEGVQLYVKGYF